MPRLQEGDQIKRVTEPAEMGEIMDSVSTTLPVLKAILEDLKGLTSGPIKDIANNTNEMIEKNSVIVERLLGRMDEIAATVEGVTTSEADDVKIALHNVREITEGLKGSGRHHAGTGSGGWRRPALVLAETATQRRQPGQIAEPRREDHRQMADGEGTVGHLLTDDTVAKNLDSITDDANSLLHGVFRGRLSWAFAPSTLPRAVLQELLLGHADASSRISFI